MPTEDRLSSAEIGELRRRLEALRRHFLAEYQLDMEHERSLPTDDTGDVVDRAELAADREALFAAAEGELDQLREIDQALARIGDGTYGLCLAGGEPISVQRLRVVPWARHCVAHQEQLEAEPFARAALSREEK